MLNNYSRLFQLELYDIGVKLSNDKRAVAAVVAQRHWFSQKVLPPGQHFHGLLPIPRDHLHHGTWGSTRHKQVALRCDTNI